MYNVLGVLCNFIDTNADFNIVVNKDNNILFTAVLLLLLWFPDPSNQGYLLVAKAYEQQQRNHRP